MITIRNDKRTILRFAAAALAVLLFCGVFCGAASAFSGTGEDDNPYVFTAEEWNALGSSNLINSSIKIVDGNPEASISPKSFTFAPSGTVTIDFSGYEGTFAGVTDATDGNKGALFGAVISNDAFILTIKNLKMEAVNVTTAPHNYCREYGGIVGHVQGNSMSNSFLKFENCTLENCMVYALDEYVGGLVGYAYKVSVNATDCIVANCSVASTGSGNFGEVGGLVGYAYDAKVNATDCQLLHCDIKAEGDGAGGLVGYAYNANVKATDCTVANCSVAAMSRISGNGYVGGLVGDASSASVNVDGCNLLHCDITAEGDNVGGLVGGANSAHNVNVKAENCLVANCSVASTGSSNVGGLVGDTYDTPVYITSCKVENTLVYAGTDDGYANAGGLVGYAFSTTSIITSNVTNCVIASGKERVGGLVGYAYSPGNTKLSGNTVSNCTVAGGEGVGGVVGKTAGNNLKSDSTGNTVEYCAVKGSTETNLVCGKPASVTNLVCTADITKNYINNNTGVFKDTIDFKNQSDVKIDPVTSDNYLTIFNVKATASLRTNPTFNPVTYLGQHGTVGGYGVVVEVGPMYTITVASSDIKNGTIDALPRSAYQGTQISVTATPFAGYHLNWTYWKNESTVCEIKNGWFTMPAKNVIVSGDFKPNVTNVTFYNDTVLVDSKLNTYKEDKNITDVIPISSEDGYTFAGWNVTAKDGTPLTDETYIKGGKWNYTAGAHEDSLDVFANWTVLKTDVTAEGGIAKFGYYNYTVMRNTNIVVRVLLENVSNVTDTAVNFTAKNTSIIDDIPDSYGNYGKDLTISIFDINASVLAEGTPAQFNVTVTFKDADTANAYKEKVKFFHYNSSGWDSEPLESTNVPNGESVIIYTVNTTSFSPFGMGIYTPKQQPPSHPSSGSSSSQGTSVWLQPTAEPTAVPTQTTEPTAAVPTASPVEPVPQASTPVPVAGVLAGLGAALVFGLRRK